jgi:hypothetical protein
MARKSGSEDTALFQFKPETIDVNYDFSAGGLPQRKNQFHATQSIQLSGPISHPEKPRQSSFLLWVYAGSDHLSEDASEGRTPIVGSASAYRGQLNGAVWVPDEHFPTLVTMALSGKLRCVSLMTHRSLHSRGGWLITNFSVSTAPEI